MSDSDTTGSVGRLTPLTSLDCVDFSKRRRRRDFGGCAFWNGWRPKMNGLSIRKVSYLKFRRILR